MFSIPIDKEIDVEKLLSECDVTSRVWHYSDGNYETTDEIEATHGYWVKVASTCKLTVSDGGINVEEFPELEKGWNQIGAPSDPINFFAIIGDCNLVSGPWWFNSNSQKFEKARVLRPGEGYFVKVKEDCKLGLEIPPLPPEEISSVITSRAVQVG
jgi:hypothetical protein